MSNEFYCFATEAEANACIGALNSNPVFPIVGNCGGKPAPDKQQTTKWVDAPTELVSGDWAVPRVPTARLDSLGVGEEDRAAFIAAFGQDIRVLESRDFPQPEEE